MESKYLDAITALRQFTDSTNGYDENDIKRSKNYLDWTTLKTKIVDDEKCFVLPEKWNDNIKRSSVVWVQFGFNIGCEFGGHHPAVVIRKMGDGLYVVPIDSGKVPFDKKDKDYLIDIPFIYDFSKKIPRHCNTYNMVKIDWRRIDTGTEIGRLHGNIMDKISKALNKYKIT